MLFRAAIATIFFASFFASSACKHAREPDCTALLHGPHATYKPSNALGEPSCAMTCESSWLDCDGVESNGCETSTTGAAPHTTVEPGAFTACAAGCAPGFFDCDDDRENGCESTTPCTRRE